MFMRFASGEYHSILLIDQVLVEAPSDDTSQTLTSYAGYQASEEAHITFLLVDFLKCI